MIEIEKCFLIILRGSTTTYNISEQLTVNLSCTGKFCTRNFNIMHIYIIYIQFSYINSHHNTTSTLITQLHKQRIYIFGKVYALMVNLLLLLPTHQLSISTPFVLHIVEPSPQPECDDVEKCKPSLVVKKKRGRLVNFQLPLVKSIRKI